MTQKNWFNYQNRAC